MENNILYKIENFKFTYPGQEGKESGIIIKDTIKIKKGEKILIKGPSGCGKSTLLLAMGGIIPEEIGGKYEGIIEYKNKNILEYKPEELHREIGIVFQNPYSQRLTPSIEDELVFYMENLNFDREEIKNTLNDIVKRFNLKYLFEQNTNNLSGGELQRIILASVLAVNPQVLLLDEPSSFLDIKGEIQLYRYLKELPGSSSIIIIDHKLNHNVTIIDRIIELSENGNISFDGNVKDYLKIHSNRKETLRLNLYPILRETKNFNYPIKVEVKNLKYSYQKDKVLIKKVNLSLKTGSVISIFGPNGSGKTTLLKIILRIIKVKDAVFINSKEYLKDKKYYKKIGGVFQNPESHFLFQTLEKEISNGKQINNIQDWLKFFSLPDKKNKNPFTLSEGQKRRINMANMLYMNKKIILLDEPTFGQDVKNIKNLAAIILSMKKLGYGFLVVSHDRWFIKLISDRVYILKNGVLKELRYIKKPV